MRVTLLGASGGEVTGSAYLLQTDRANVMIDCGLFQGARKLENYNRLPRRPLKDLHAIVLTHAHLDHTGRLPLLVRFGWRAIVDGAKSVRIMGKQVPVRATTHTFGGLSGHAGQKDLLAWIGALAPCKPRVLLTHGEDGPRRALASLVLQRYGLETESPDYPDTIEI